MADKIKPYEDKPRGRSVYLTDAEWEAFKEVASSNRLQRTQQLAHWILAAKKKLDADNAKDQ
jgi:hypothetical protein